MNDDIRQSVDLLRAESAFWALDPRHFDGLVARIARQANSSAPVTSRRPANPAPNVAVVPIVGPLVKRGGFLAQLFGLSSYDQIRAQLAQAVADRSVDKIGLYIDSPGGSVTGCEECAASVQAAAKIKPVVAFCDGLMASAAFWIGSQANSITITPSGEAGSVGVISLHLDYSEALKTAGVRPTFLVSKVSPYKAASNQLQPLDAGAKARAQADIDAVAAKFVSAVARGRSTNSTVVTERFGKGDCLLANAALAAGMVDAVGDFERAVGASVARVTPSATAGYRTIVAEAARAHPAPGEKYRRILEAEAKR